MKWMSDSFRPWLLSESRVDYASLRSGASHSSGSVVALGLRCFSGPEYTTLAAQSGCVGFTVCPLWSWVLWLTPGNSQKNCFLFLLKEGWNFGFVLVLSWSKTCEAGLWPPKNGALCEGNPLCFRHKLQGNLVTTSCESFFRCTRKCQLSVDFASQFLPQCQQDSSVQTWALGLPLSIQCRNRGQQQRLLRLYCITQAGLEYLVSQAGWWSRIPK